MPWYLSAVDVTRRDIALDFSVELASCVVCDGEIRPFTQYRHYVRMQPWDLSYQRCRRCGLVQMSPRPTAESMEDFYREGYRGQYHGQEVPEGDNLTTQSGRARHLASLVGRDVVSHLDVGASSGTLLVEVGASRQVAIEPGDVHRQAARERGLEAHATLDELRETRPEPFGLISMSHVLEHTHDPVAVLTDLRDLLSDDGLLLLEVPNLYGSRCYEIAHLLAFTAPTLHTMLGVSGFRPVVTKLHDEPDGGLGGPRCLAVVAGPYPPSPPARRPEPALWTKLRRVWGIGPQRVPVYRARLRRWLRRRRPASR